MDPNDSSYQPSEVVVYGGDNITCLRELKTIHIGPDDSLVTLLQDMHEVGYSRVHGVDNCRVHEVGNCRVHEVGNSRLHG